MTRVARLMTLCLMATASVAHANLIPYRPTTEEVRANYAKADSLRQQSGPLVVQATLVANWANDRHFWFVREGKDGARSHVLIDSKTVTEEPLFDHAEFAKQLSELAGRQVDAVRLALRAGRLTDDLEHFEFQFGDGSFDWNRVTKKMSKVSALGGSPRQTNAVPRPSSDFEVRIQDGKVEAKAKSGGDWKVISTQGGFVRVSFCPDGKSVVGIRVIPGDRKEVFTVKSTENPLRGVLQTRKYDQPGDKLDTAEYFVYDLATGKESKVETGEVICGGYPWASPPNIDWWKPGDTQAWTFMLDFNVRGFQEYKVLRVAVPSGEVKTVVAEKEKTFFDTTKMQYRRLEKSPTVVWRSERDRWGHLYLIDADSGTVKKQITSGSWVTRDIVRVDEEKGQIYFTGNGREAGDPYFLHLYRVNFDGTGLKTLTEGEGTHSQAWSTAGSYFVDTWSSPSKAPVFELRDKDGKLLKALGQTDDSQLRGINLSRPEPFTAKGRDGKTDIYGLIFRPRDFDPAKSYPVIENIYAGPHDSHVPKSYSVAFYSQQVAEIGFIVVQIDGMGTNNRGKDFHDVCWRNLKDAGFPDRIAWMTAAASRYPQMDITRVGIFGTSAGGQNAAGALLFHPEFYKSAVASCGCHDNRIDKYWWNEQWMGYPVGPWYAESSNIDNAAKLKGKLLLMVGEVDSNVPPESTYKFEEALMKAGKDFEFVHLPGQDHTAGGQYGERKRRDFFVKTLLGVEPPQWNNSRAEVNE